MREIKFRAWDRKEEEMIYGALHILNIGFGDGSIAVDTRAQRGNELDWMQYTGLRDKKGREIYEDDILKLQGAPPFVVKWDNRGEWCLAQDQGSLPFIGTLTRSNG